MDILLLFLGVFLFVLFLSVINPGGKDLLASSFPTSPLKVWIYDKERRTVGSKDGRDIYSYVIVVSETSKSGKKQKAREIEVDSINYAQMRKDTEIELFFDEKGKCESYRLISTRLPISR